MNRKLTSKTEFIARKANIDPYLNKIEMEIRLADKRPIEITLHDITDEQFNPIKQLYIKEGWIVELKNNTVVLT